MYYNEYEYPMYSPEQTDERFFPLGFGLGFGFGRPFFPFFGRRFFFPRRPFFHPGFFRPRRRFWDWY